MVNLFLHVAHAAFKLARLASNGVLCFELNRLFGRFIGGAIRHRRLALQQAESLLLQQVQTDVDTICVHVAETINIHTVVAGNVAARLRNRAGPSADMHQRGSPSGTTTRVSGLTGCGRRNRHCFEKTGHFLRPGPNPVVLLHGHSMGGATWFKNIDDLVHLGFTDIYAPDLPGWGRSCRPRYQASGANGALDYFLVPLVKWLDAVGLSQFVMIGHSLGAYLAHELARLRPSSIRKLVMVAPAAVTRHTPLNLALWFRFTPQRILTHGGFLAHILFSLKFPTAEVYNAPGFREYLRLANSIGVCSGDAAAVGIVRVWRSGRLGLKLNAECTRPLEENLGKLAPGIVLIAGGDDCLVPIASIRQLYSKLSGHGNTVALHVIGDADHSPHIATPDSFAKVLLMHVIPEMAPIPDVARSSYSLETPAALADAVAPSPGTSTDHAAAASSVSAATATTAVIAATVATAATAAATASTRKRKGYDDG